MLTIETEGFYLICWEGVDFALRLVSPTCIFMEEELLVQRGHLDHTLSSPERVERLKYREELR